MQPILYDILYIVDVTIERADQQKIQDEIKAIILENGGEILKENVWGKMTLAFPIEKKTEGLYVNLEFKALPTVPKLIEQYDLTHTGLLRHLTLRVPKAKLIQEKRDEEKRRKELEAAERARQAALAAEAKAEVEAAMAESKAEADPSAETPVAPAVEPAEAPKEAESASSPAVEASTAPETKDQVVEEKPEAE
ncbi:MAG: 30S ribosomal protein S6 [bacterium]|jgi:small subunit ribosomal protein S6|nr:30S ribosomal protein S6 [bacterium]